MPTDRGRGANALVEDDQVEAAVRLFGAVAEPLDLTATQIHGQPQVGHGRSSASISTKVSNPGKLNATRPYPIGWINPLSSSRART